MPWDIRSNYGSCSGYAVVKRSDGSIAGCHTTREKAVGQIAALEASEAGKSMSSEITKAEDLYSMLTDEEKAFHDALVSIAQQYGPFDLGTSSIWVGYEEASDNENASIGVKCGNCSFHYEKESGALGCKIVSFEVQENAKCRLAAIPDGLVNTGMDDIMDDMEKADSVRVGQMVSWNSSGGRATGKVKRVVRNGSYSVPDSDFTITGTPDNPAVVIEVYRDGKPSGTMVGHKMSTLRSVSKSLLIKMYSVVENHPGCVGGFAVVDEDGKMDGCFASREQADMYAKKENVEEEYEDMIEDLEQQKEMAEESVMGKSMYVMENYIGCVGGYAVVDKTGAIYGCYKSLSEAKSKANMSKSTGMWDTSAFAMKKI